MADVDLSDVQQEYWFHVSPQEALPLAGTVDVGLDLDRVAAFFRSVAAVGPERTRSIVAQLLVQQPALFGDVRQFLGISDKRAYLDLSYVASRTKHPETASALCGCYPWTLARHPLAFFTNLLVGKKGKAVQAAASLMMADYLLKHGLERSAPGFAAMNPSVLEMLYARLISPKEYQQRAAKRRGHGCESALAAVLSAVGLDIVPDDKATNPMGARDPNVDLETMEEVTRTAGLTHSFDMIIRQGGATRVLIQSLIHTSDPGQYGVNKSDETVTIDTAIKRWLQGNQKRSVELWALLDGVGFSENKPDTINKLLATVDYFVQLKTLFKAPIRAHELGLTKVLGILFSDYYTGSQKKQLASHYVPGDVRILSREDEAPNGWAAVPAGEAVIYVEAAKSRSVSSPLELSEVD